MAKTPKHVDEVVADQPALGRSPWENNIIGHGVSRAADLLAHPGNIKIHPQFQAETLEGSLESLGWIQEVIVNKRLGDEWGEDRYVETLVDGHERVVLALRHGDDTPVPVKFVNLSPSQENLSLLIYDAIAALAMDDKAKLDSATRQAETTKAALQQLIAQRASAAGLIPPDVTFKEYDESVENEVKWIECPACQHRWPK